VSEGRGVGHRLRLPRLDAADRACCRLRLLASCSGVTYLETHPVARIVCCTLDAACCRSRLLIDVFQVSCACLSGDTCARAESAARERDVNLQLSALAQYTLVCLWLTDWLADCGSCALGQRTLQTSLFGAQPNMMHGVSRTSTNEHGYCSRQCRSSWPWQPVSLCFRSREMVMMQPLHAHAQHYQLMLFPRISRLQNSKSVRARLDPTEEIGCLRRTSRRRETRNA
jgi:hypothetical protein